MIRATNRWIIPLSLRQEFLRDWEMVARNVAIPQHGAVHCILMDDPSLEGGFMAATLWETEDAWTLWRDKQASHPLHLKYRQYVLGEPVKAVVRDALVSVDPAHPEGFPHAKSLITQFAEVGTQRPS